MPSVFDGPTKNDKGKQPPTSGARSGSVFGGGAAKAAPSAEPSGSFLSRAAKDLRETVSNVPRGLIGTARAGATDLNNTFNPMSTAWKDGPRKGESFGDFYMRTRPLTGGLAKSFGNSGHRIGQGVVSLKPGGLKPSDTQFAKDYSAHPVSSLVEDAANASIVLGPVSSALGKAGEAANAAGAARAGTTLGKVAETTGRAAEIGNKIAAAPMKPFELAGAAAGKVLGPTATAAYLKAAEDAGPIGKTLRTVRMDPASRAVRKTLFEGQEQLSDATGRQVALAQRLERLLPDKDEQAAHFIVGEGEAQALAKARAVLPKDQFERLVTDRYGDTASLKAVNMAADVVEGKAPELAARIDEALAAGKVAPGGRLDRLHDYAAGPASREFQTGYEADPIQMHEATVKAMKPLPRAERLAAGLRARAEEARSRLVEADADIALRQRDRADAGAVRAAEQKRAALARQAERSASRAAQAADRLTSLQDMAEAAKVAAPATNGQAAALERIVKAGGERAVANHEMVTGERRVLPAFARIGRADEKAAVAGERLAEAARRNGGVASGRAAERASQGERLVRMETRRVRALRAKADSLEGATGAPRPPIEALSAEEMNAARRRGETPVDVEALLKGDIRATRHGLDAWMAEKGVPPRLDLTKPENVADFGPELLDGIDKRIDEYAAAAKVVDPRFPTGLQGPQAIAAAAAEHLRAVKRYLTAQLEQPAPAARVRPLYGEGKRLGTLEARHRELEARATSAEARLGRLRANVTNAAAKTAASVDAAPARLRPLLSGNRAVVKEIEAHAQTLRAAGDEASAVAVEKAAQEIPVTRRALKAQGIDVDHFIHVQVGDKPIGGGGQELALPKVRKTRAEKFRTGSAAYDRTFRAQAQAELDELKGGIARETATKIESLPFAKKFAKPADAAEAGYVAWDPKNIFEKNPTPKPGTTYIPQHVFDSFRSYFNNPKWDQVIGSYYDKPLRVWKVAVLPLSPSWQVGNLVGNAMLATLGAGVDPITLSKSMVEAIKSYRASGPKGMRELPGPRRLYTSGATYSEFDYLRGAGEKTARSRVGQKLEPLTHAAGHAIRKSYALNSFVDDFGRSAVFLSKKAEGLSEEAALRESLKAMGDFSRMTPVERRFVKRVIPFYAWQRHMTQLALRLPVEHPMRTAWTLHLANEFGQPDPELAGLPDFMRGSIPLPGGKLLGTNSFFPFGDAGKILSVRGIEQSLSPILKIADQSRTGRNLFTGRPFTRPPGTGRVDDLGRELPTAPSILKQVTDQVPQKRLLEAATGRNKVVRYDSGDKVITSHGPIPSDKTPAQAVLRWLGIPVSNRDAAVAEAKRVEAAKAKLRKDAETYRRRSRKS